MLRKLVAGALALAFAYVAAPAHAQQTTGAQPLGIADGGTGAATAAAARTALGLQIGLNVEAWDADLDCLAAISTTGVIKRTGAGTCSAGTVALSDLATGTQDTVIGYFGSTTASAIAIGNCSTALTYSTATHTFGCGAGGGVTSVTCNGGVTVITTTGTCPSRELLTGNRTYFVRTDGSNSNTGLVNSAGGAFLTPQKCYDVITATLDLSGFTVTCSLVNTSSPSTFTTGVAVTQPWTGGGAVTFAGSTGTATDVVVSTTSANAFSTTGSLPGTLTIKDMKIQTTTGGDGIFHQAAGLVQFTNINFGAVAATHIDCVGSGVNCEATGNYTISGGGQTHVTASRPSNVSIRAGKTITLSGTPAFSTAFALSANGGVIAIDGMTFTGSATGSRFNVQNGGQIYTGTSGSATYLPGNAAGTGTNYGTSPFGLYNLFEEIHEVAF